MKELAEIPTLPEPTFVDEPGEDLPRADVPCDDAELIERAKTDPDAFGELYELHYSAILNYLYRRTLSASTAEELTSNTFFKAMRGLPGYHPRPGVRFRAWLYRIATNEIGMHWRSREVRGVPRGLPEDGDVSRVTYVWPEMESAESAQEKREQFAVVHRAMSELPEVYRSALTLRYFEGLALEEVASVLEKPTGTVKSLVHRGLGKLAEAMAKLER